MAAGTGTRTVEGAARLLGLGLGRGPILAVDASSRGSLDRERAENVGPITYNTVAVGEGECLETPEGNIVYTQ